MAVIEERKNAKGQKSYRVKVRMKGYPVQTATFQRKTDAKIWAQNTESAIREGRYFGYATGKRKLMADLIDRYIDEILPLKPKSIVDQKRQLTYWKNRIGHLTIQEVTPSVVTSVRNDLSKGIIKGGAKRSNGTVNRYLAVLSHAFTIAMKEWEWVNDNPCMKVSKLKEARGRDRYLSKAEKSRLLESCRHSDSEYLYFIVVLALSTGARKNEILSLKWEDVHFDRGVIELKETKNGEKRILPLQGNVFKLIFELFKHRNIFSEYLFPSPHTNLKPVCIRNSFEAAIKKAGIENFRFHDLRHTSASYMAMDGATIPDIASVLGHKTLQMVQRYAHLSEAHTKKVVASMNEKMFDGEDLLDTSDLF